MLGWIPASREPSALGGMLFSVGCLDTLQRCFQLDFSEIDSSTDSKSEKHNENLNSLKILPDNTLGNSESVDNLDLIT